MVHVIRDKQGKRPERLGTLHLPETSYLEPIRSQFDLIGQAWPNGLAVTTDQKVARSTRAGCTSSKAASRANLEAVVFSKHHSISTKRYKGGYKVWEARRFDGR